MSFKLYIEAWKDLTKWKVEEGHSLQAEKNPQRNTQKPYEVLGNRCGVFLLSLLLTESMF